MWLFKILLRKQEVRLSLHSDPLKLHGEILSRTIVNDFQQACYCGCAFVVFFLLLDVLVLVCGFAAALADCKSTNPPARVITHIVWNSG